MKAVLLLGVLVLLVPRAGGAQWLNYPDARIPRTAEGKPNLSAPASRLPDGHVDFSGVWYPDPVRTDPTAASATVEFPGENPVIRLDTPDGAPVPFLPGSQAALAAIEQRSVSPATQCLPHTVVDSLLVPSPFKFVHSSGLTMLLLEEFNHFRQIFTDGRPFPADMQPAWFGYSIGRWDDDAFVVETRGLNDRGEAGRLKSRVTLMNSETMHITERYRRPTIGSLALQITFDDPKIFSRPWTTQTIWFRLLPDTDFIEHICDNEKDVQRINAVRAADAAR